LKVYEPDGDIDTETKTDYIDVTKVNEQPIADPNGPYTSTEGALITFDGFGSSDPDGNIVSYAWDFGDGNTGTGVDPTHTYIQDGIYTVTLTATDNDAATNQASTTTTIISEDTTSPIIASPHDHSVEINAAKNITWIITEKNPDKYRVLRNDTEVISPTSYKSGVGINISINTSTLGVWNYTIFANDTLANTAKGQVNITVLEKIQLNITITSPIDGYSTNSNSILVNGYVNGNGTTPAVTVNGYIAEVENTGSPWAFSKSISLSTGINTITATATDDSGSNKSVSITITRKSTDNSGGGSSGGRGGSSGESYYNIQISETERENVYKDSRVCYSFDKEGNIIRYINFTGLTSSGQVTAKVEMLKDTSSLVDIAPPDMVYRNLNIWVGNLGWATQQNIADPTISSKVERIWISKNKIDESTIILYRYSDGIWNPLTTTKIGEDADYLYFETKTPGYSPFALTGKVTIDLPGEKAQPGGESMDSEPLKEEKPNQTADEKPSIPGFGVCATLSILMAAFQLLQKRK
jgi:PGF-pre-PGF domain-containing protein